MSKCKRCHREIKNPKSVQNGYGPVCWSKMHAGTVEPDKPQICLDDTDANGDDKEP